MSDLSGKRGVRHHELNLALEALHFAFRAVVKGPDAILAGRGLSRVHHRILFFIAKSPGLRVSELLATLGVTKQAMNGPLRQLTARGLVSEAVDVEDRRSKHLHLTASGRALEDRLSGHQRKRFARAFRKVGRAKEQSWREVMMLLGAEETGAAPTERAGGRPTGNAGGADSKPRSRSAAPAAQRPTAGGRVLAR